MCVVNMYSYCHIKTWKHIYSKNTYAQFCLYKVLYVTLCIEIFDKRTEYGSNRIL